MPVQRMVQHHLHPASFLHLGPAGSNTGSTAMHEDKASVAAGYSTVESAQQACQLHQLHALMVAMGGFPADVC